MTLWHKMLATTLLCALPLCATAQNAMTTTGFVNSIGVVTHLGYEGTPYANIDVTQRTLAYLGICNVRDAPPADPTLLVKERKLASIGIKFDLVTGYGDLSQTLFGQIAGAAQLAASRPGSVRAVEAPNELNGDQVVYLNGASSKTPQIGAAIVRAVSSAVRSNPILAAQKVAVYNLSINNGGSGWQNYVAGLGNLSSLVTAGNWHVYMGGHQPLSAMSRMYQNAKQSAPSAPVVFTETGYTTSPKAGDYGGGVDNATQAKNTLNGLFDAYKMGVQQIYLYELLNGSANPAPNDSENNFGLFYSDGRPKAAATALHNLTSVLQSTTGPTGGAPLSSSIADLPANAYSMALTKPDGSTALLIWNEAPDWNSSTRSEIPQPTTRITIKFGTTYAFVHVFDPIAGRDATQTLTTVSSVQLSLSGNPLIVEVGASLPSVATIAQSSVISPCTSSIPKQARPGALTLE